jgi:catalase
MKESRMSNRTMADGAGTGWIEVYLNGSKSAEEKLITQRFAPEINRIQKDIQRIEGAQRIKRAQHGKMLAGTKNAEFQVLPDIPDDLRIGLFQPGKSYPAHARFSNASSIEQPDSARDLRGVAIRVKPDVGSDHDFLMTNAPYSHARDSKQFMIIASAASRVGRPAMLWRLGAWRTLAALVRLVRRLGLKEALRVLRTVRQQTSRPVASLATESYWSRAAFAFGPVAVKFKLEPATKDDSSQTQQCTDLRAELLARLRQGGLIFDFKVQRYVDEDRTPIEDGTVEWKEEDAPFVTIARLVIPSQELNQADELEVDSTAFNPWNTSSEEFRPLGSMNRARQAVYEASARLRSET